MHYGADRPSILKHDPFKAIISPRPIGWIGTLNSNGVPNLSPYSYFAAMGDRPNMVMFSSDGLKHSFVNARASGEFTFSLATEALTNAMNQSSAPVDDDVDEFALAGLALGKSVEISAPFVEASPAALECVVIKAEQLSDRHGNPLARYMIIGEVVRTHIRDEYITPDGRFDTVKARPIARMGYHDYATVKEAWEMQRPPV